MMRAMSPSVLLLHNLPSEEPLFRAACGASDAGVSQAVRHVAEALAAWQWPHRVAGVRHLTELPVVLQAGAESVVFNLVERLDGGEQECSFVPAICRAFGRACTGGTAESLVLTLDKDLTKRRLSAHGVRTPAGVVVPVGTRVPDALPGGAWFVKPLSSDGSEGIELDSLIHGGDRTALAAAVARVHAKLGQAALVEEFIAGREFNLSIVEGAGQVVPLPVSEIDFALFPKGRPHFVDYAVKWQPGLIAGQVSPRRVPAQVDDALAARLRAVARHAWQACGCQDYARVDTRLDAAGEIYVLDVNINCDLSPLAGLPAAWQATGAPFAAFVRQMIENACRRKSANHDTL
jgi:D-alanine-D-alanine ligase